MSDVFPKWTNRLPRLLLIGAALVLVILIAGMWYYFTPKYARVGYQPVQPVAFSHEIHAGQLGLDCRYCHDDVERSWHSNVPDAAVCMNCHNQVLAEDARLALVRESAETDKPIPWVQIHKTPDFVFFNHAAHVNRGVSCVECHGRVDQMDEVYHAKDFSMSFCLKCHRNPAERLRPLDKITDMDWQWSEDPHMAAQLQKEHGEKFVEEWNIRATDNCSACHR